MNNHKITLFFLLISFSLSAQMEINGDTLYGNEWINYDQEYIKIKIGSDGIYRLNYNALNEAGAFSGSQMPQGSHFQLFNKGSEIPIFTTTNGSMSGSDYIEFEGLKNRGELDVHLFLEQEYQLNDKVSMFNDTSAYFLTWDITSSSNARISTIPNDLSNPPLKEDYCLHVEEKLYTTWQRGRKDPSFSAQFDLGEGNGANVATSQSVPIPTPHVYNEVGAPNAIVNLRSFTKGGNHQTTISIGSNVYIDTTYSGWAVPDYYFEVPAAALGNNSTTLSLQNSLGSDDKVGIAYGTIRYPRSFDFGNATNFPFTLMASASEQYIEITNFNAGGIAPVLYDLTNNLRIVSALDGNNLIKLVLPPSPSSRNLVLVSQENLAVADVAYKKVFVDFSASPTDYLIISNRMLFDDGMGVDRVQEYADYRRSMVGGNFNAQIAEIHEVYDQFSYGIERHEISLRNFTHYMIGASDLGYVFLLGDGSNYSKIKSNYSSVVNKALVPTYGYPTSDHLIATGNSSNVPKVPVGRLVASNGGEVDIYLRKVKAFEMTSLIPQTVEDKAWMKRAIHLGGGDSGIQATIKSKLNGVKAILEEGTFGGKVHSFFKTSSDVIQEAPSEQIELLMNEGVSLVTFFGHSAPSTLDFDLESPESYNNFEKYPLLYTIGCHASRMMEFEGTLSEQWVLAEDKGAIAFLGATWETSLTNLAEYAEYFYQNFATDNYGGRLGDILKATIEDFDLNSSFYAEQLKQVMILHGDPALKINPHEGPDYIVNSETVSTSPLLINNQMENFDFNFKVNNLGFAVGDSLRISIKHKLPNDEVIESVSVKGVSPGFQSEHIINVTLPKSDQIIGLNTLTIVLDPIDSIPESPSPIAEMNNEYSYSFYILANDAFPVYPYEYSIVSNPNLVLKASTANTFAETARYYLEIDTTGVFDSNLKQSTVLIQEGGLIQWEPTIPLVDSTVYYWRISIDSTETVGNGFNWHESSFVYIEDSYSGWNQSHFHQLTKENDYIDLELEEPSRKMTYGSKGNELKMKFAAHPIIPWQDNASVLNNEILTQFRLCLDSSAIAFAVFDPYTIEPWVNTNQGGLVGEHDSYHCQSSGSGINWFIYVYRTNTMENREKAIHFLENVVPSNSYVLAYTLQKEGTSYAPESWALDSLSNSFGMNLFEVLEAQGAQLIRQTINEARPYYYFFQKDNPNMVSYGPREMIAESDTSTIEGTVIFESLLDRGNLKSTIIGPAEEWQSLIWNMETYDPVYDEVNLNVYGRTLESNGTEYLLHKGISVFDTTLTHIDAGVYPYLRLEFESKDSIQKSTPHLDFWRVLYSPVPEAALRPDLKFSFQSDTVQQGEDLVLDIAVENISEIDMDSILVHYTVIDQNNNAVLTDTRMAPLLKGDTLQAHLSFDTRAISTSINQLIIDVNPNNDQLEQHHFNNVGVKQFHILLDKKNPLLDVTFDGVHILDGDLVSAKPLINIILKDENKNLALNDTALFRVKILYPNETEPREFLSSDEGVTFYPADENDLGKENKARIELRESFQDDGVYELSVRAEDRTGNDSGDFDYKIRFEVINEAMVSNVLNYPNPFSTSTQFVFTLTGSEVPDFMKIQVMSVSGKVVREITNDELGPIHIGKNMTEYRWDGTDEFGDRLANGVYLYRVITREVNGDEYKNYNTNTSQYFKKGIGKMVIIR